MIQTLGSLEPSPRALRIMRICSMLTALCSFGFAFAYASRPQSLAHNLFGALAIHWTWAMIQLLLGIGIIAAHIRGGYHLQLAHGIGFVVQFIYCLLWIGSAIATGSGWFVWPGVMFLAAGHFVLSRLKWRHHVRRGMVAT